MDVFLPKYISSAFNIKNYDVIFDKKKLKKCGFCGENKGFISPKDILISTMKEKELFPDAEAFCIECAFALRNEMFRKNNFIISGQGHSIKYQKMMHADVWNILFSEYEIKKNDGGLKTPYFISLTTSHKKSNVCYGVVNLTKSNTRTVVYEQELITYDIKDKYFSELVYSLYNEYKQTKENILKGEYNVAFLNADEYDKLIELDEQLQVLKDKNLKLFELLVYYVPKKEE